MSSTAYADDFTNLAGWTGSGLTATAGEVKASSDNSLGKITRVYETVAGGSLARIGVDFVVDTSMTTDTYASVSLLDASSSFGPCIYVKQGVGIACSRYFPAPGFDQVTVLLAWASLVNGGRYHIEWTVNTPSTVATYSLYDPSGNLVTRNIVTASTGGWFDVTRLVVESNSNKTTISRLAIDPNIMGSTTTGKYFSNIAKFTFYLTSANVPVTIATPGTGVNPVDGYIPGGSNNRSGAVYFHGAGQTPQFIEATTLTTGGTVIRGCLTQGVMVIVPSIPVNSGGGDSWGNDFGAASVVAAIANVRALIGDTSAPMYFIGYSMGMLTAGRLIGYDNVLNVKGLYCLRGCCDIADNEQGAFASQIDTAWGVSHQADLATAQATFARGNPIGLLGTYPSKFAGVAIYMDYSTTGDTTVPQATNCAAFDALLTTKNITHRTSLKPYVTHTETSAVGDAEAFLSQVAASQSGGGRSVGSMAMVL